MRHSWKISSRVAEEKDLTTHPSSHRMAANNTAKVTDARDQSTVREDSAKAFGSTYIVEVEGASKDLLKHATTLLQVGASNTSPLPLRIMV